MNNRGYLYVALCHKGQKKTVQIHRLVCEHFKPNPDNKPYVDHINLNKNDNRDINLRWSTWGENECNKEKRNGGTSKYKGVCWKTKENKWQTQICKNGKRLNLGLYDDEKDAANVYNQKAIELFGEFARLNDISEDEE